ncbi:MAG: hypothetical protein ACFNKE_09990, partial [Neisseria elongata]
MVVAVVVVMVVLDLAPAFFAVEDDKVCWDASNQEIIRRYFKALVDALTADTPYPEGTDSRWTGGQATPAAAVAAYRAAIAAKSD